MLLFGAGVAVGALATLAILAIAACIASAQYSHRYPD